MATRITKARRALRSLLSDDVDGSRDRRGERGAAVAELAMVMPVILLMLVVVFDLGRGFVAYVSVKDAARDGARVAIQVDKTCTDDAEPAAENAAAPYTVAAAAVWDSTASSCTVTVDHTYTPVLPFVTSEFELPGIGKVGPLWDGSLSETAVSFK